MQYTIEKNVPFPPPKNSKAIYPFQYMEIGDSFVCSDKNLSTVSSAAQYAKRKFNYKFTIRKQAVGHRVWRIA